MMINLINHSFTMRGNNSLITNLLIINKKKRMIGTLHPYRQMAICARAIVKKKINVISFALN